MVVIDQVNICGIPHKIGVNGFVFMLMNGDWVRSSKSAGQVQRLLDGVAKKKDADVWVRRKT